MSSVLETLDWSQPALKLLSNIQSIDTAPAILHIRHSERINTHPMTLTEIGKQASYDFGTKLPPNKTYRLYHTERSRTKNTAKQIHEALSDREITSKIIGDIGRPEKYKLENLRQYFSIEREQGSDNPVRSFFYHWIGGRYPSESVLSVVDFGRWMSDISLENLKSASEDSVDVYVSHEIWVAAFMYSWLGYNPVNWVSFLDGFLVQLRDDNMKYCTEEDSRTIYYPHWWNF